MMTREEAKEIFLRRGFIKADRGNGVFFDGNKWREACYVISEWLKEEPRKGKWEHGKELCREYQGKTLLNITYKDWNCSNCHCVIDQSEKPKWNFCPNCGVDMREVEE